MNPHFDYKERPSDEELLANLKLQLFPDEVWEIKHKPTEADLKQLAAKLVQELQARGGK